MVALPNDIGYRARVGEWTAGEVDETYDISRLTRQNDQPDTLDWLILNDNDVLSRFATIVDGFDGSRGGMGGINWTWDILTTENMRDFIERQWFDKTKAFDGNLSKRMTLRTYDAKGGQGWQVIQATARLEESIREGHAWLMRISFVDGLLAPLGVDMTVSQSVSHDLLYTIDSDILFTLTNVGDTVTSGNIVFVYTIPTNTDFVSVIAPTYTIEYFDGSIWSVVPPTPLTDVEQIRCTYTQAVSPQNSPPSITVTLNGTSKVTTTSAATVTATGDYDNTNDTSSVDYTIRGRAFSKAFSKAFN